MNLTHKDIIARQRNLITDSYIANINCNIPHVYDTLSESYSYSKAKMILENWQALSNSEEEALTKVLEVFGMIVDNDNHSNIENAANIIEGKIIPKLRNAKQTRLLNNYKRGWIKHRHTSVLNDTKDNENAVQRAKANGGYLGNSLHPHRKYKRDIYGRKMGEVKNNSNGGDNEDNTSSEEVAEECYNRFVQKAWINEQCDRVLNNHAKLSKRFDLESKVRKCPLNEVSLQKCIYDICSLIESYDIPFGVKYNIALENIMYLMTKNCIPVNNSFITESVTDYFLMEEVTDERLHDMKYILENVKFFSDEDIEPISYLIVDEGAIIEALENDDLESLEENKIHDMFLKWKEKRIKTNKEKNEIAKMKIKKIIHDFKKEHRKDINKFKSAITRIFVQPPEAIIQELPDIMQFVRLGVIIAATSFNPILGVITLITDLFLKMKISREQMAKVVEQYTKERDKYKKLADETEDEKKKEKYTALYKQYKNDTETLEMRENDLYTDAENDKRMEEKWAKEAEMSSGDDFDFDFDMDFDFDEAVKYVGMLSVLYEQLDFTKAELMSTIKNNIHSMSNEDIYNITEAVKLCNEVFDCPRYITILEDELARSRHSYSGSYITNIQKIDTLKNCIYDIEKIKYDNLLSESTYISNDSTPPPIGVIYEHLKCKHDIMNDTLELLTRYKNSSINESKENSGLSFTSKLKIASENLRRTALTLKDKDKQLSMKLDSEINRVMKSAKRAMISDSRESIIRGSFLPSASKCIHIALASGAAYLIDPVLAVIGLIGFIGCSKILNEKERNLILDDIDIEIKMCDKYLKIAEDKDDLTAVREIMKTKRDLERQRARILYNKNYVFRNKKQYDMPDKIDKKLDKDD